MSRTGVRQIHQCLRKERKIAGGVRVVEVVVESVRAIPDDVLSNGETSLVSSSGIAEGPCAGGLVRRNPEEEAR